MEEFVKKAFKIFLAVIFVLVMLALLFFIRMSDSMKPAQVKETRLIIGYIAKDIESFRETCGRLPTASEGLSVLNQNAIGCPKWEPKRLILKDSFNHDLIYFIDNSGRDFDIVSYGADGKLGGDGYDADIAWSALK